MPDITFQPWPKIARLNRDIVVTEKIDGTNAAIQVTEDGEVGAQSRSRVITPADDNFGFARWVYGNADRLAKLLGPGCHFGEYWGSGIQRGYGLPKGEKRFSLFNTHRWGGIEESSDGLLHSVPVLYRGPFGVDVADAALRLLDESGSRAAPGFQQPEGIVIFHTAANLMFKVTIDGDDAPKSAVA